MAKQLYLGDFNVCIDQQNSVDVNKFRSILNDFVMKNHVNKATHNLWHILDLVFECVENSKVGCEKIEPQNIISDHMVQNFKSFVDDIPKNTTVIIIRHYKSLDVVDF